MTSLAGVKVLDLTRVFSGPWATQIMADFGADVIKVERPGRGDDVRHQGVRARDANGAETQETSSFLAMNRGKRSITVDMTQAEGQDILRRLARECDVLVENYKPGDLARYGLDYEALRADTPRLVYCSISGFGQTGPFSHLPGYDPIFQSMSGFMSITGLPDGVPGGGPMRTGFALGDINAGLYAVIAVLAALRHRDMVSGQGQYIDLALFDAQVAVLSHISMIYLVSGKQPPRMGTASPITCPYQAFECSDGQIMVTVGNDSQFRQFAALLGHPEWADDERFATNPARARNQAELVPLIQAVMRTRTVAQWYGDFDKAGVPSGPINDFAQAFENPQIVHRGMRMEMLHPTIGAIPQVANPVRFSASPVRYERPPPVLGQHTREVLAEVLGMTQADIDKLVAGKVV
jgi:crotonobetainyl-CoA:carnitine CoA-transferase CaiB-like acyl-CoA transferase